jgi:hypothetical protein
MKKQVFVLFCLLFLPLTAIYSQEAKYPKNYFASPLKIPLLLSGNFGEIRSNHFHAGLDIKTQGVEGHEVLASADGYISRIKVAWGGYGKVLYIQHPNGYTTTYAHLQRFSPDIEAFVKKNQYANKSFAVEIFPTATQFTVKQGDIIAYSGNTGGSGGPHLHFEIRDSGTETPLNPLLFGFDIKDNIPPVLKTLGIYPLSENASVNNGKEAVFVDITGTNGKYIIPGGKSFELSGKIGFGIETIDYLNNSSNRCGAFSIELLKDNKRVYYHDMQAVAFDESRYINSHVDYFAWNKLKKKVQKSYKDPNNKLGIYGEMENNGIIDFNRDTSHLISYIVTDVYGNISQLNFTIKAKKPEELSDSINSETDKLRMRYDKENLFETENFKVYLPAKILYDDIDFTYSEAAPIPGAFTPTHKVHFAHVPLHSYMDLFIKVDGVDEKILREKAVIVYLGDNYKVSTSEGGKYFEGFMNVKTRSFGNYTVMIDSVPPIIKPINIYNNKNMSTLDTLMVLISDNLSGIKSFNAYINGEWVLMEYDKKTKRLFHVFEQNAQNPAKEYTFSLEVTDEKNNKAVYQAKFLR